MKTQQKPILMSYLSELINAQFENRTPREIPDEISLAELEKIARTNHMEYLLLGSLIKLPIPNDMMEKFRMRVKRSVFKTLQQVCEAKKLQEQFEKSGIRNQVLKGAVLKHLYPKPEMREMSDIDFMIYEEAFENADQIMQEMQYTRKEAVKHHVVYMKAPSVVMEMHWSLYEKTVDKGQYLYYKDNFRAVLKEGCQYTYEFSKEDFYVYMISHMAKHFYENGCGIRNLLDIYVYWEKYHAVMDLKMVEKELEKCGLSAFEEHARKMAYIWMKNENSSEFYNNMFLYMLDCGIYGKAENGVWAQMAKQDAGDNGNTKANYFFPSYEYMKEDYPWLDGKKVLLPVAWGIRGMNGLLNKNFRNKIAQIEDKEKVETMKRMYQTLHLKFVK